MSKLGCTSPCGAGQSFDFIKKKCLTPKCDGMNEVLLDSGDCQQCSDFFERLNWPHPNMESELSSQEVEKIKKCIEKQKE
eukprot:CAMPEP_0170511614 /NCGR_PEP_ID=MMETSP0208-20121228/66403_1 /TAXON_ID=197538 /ORGANISM="Strombidium inclinatum, Strain S3" /LENGTH=79 /DNA_ID=CAMNT_0010795173 /DNA_START=603 /DNA_END=839 /DNA_ORIENTATION=-